MARVANCNEMRLSDTLMDRAPLLHAVLALLTEALLCILSTQLIYLFQDVAAHFKKLHLRQMKQKLHLLKARRRINDGYD